jgi:Family of unknown function (DUF6544)
MASLFTQYLEDIRNERGKVLSKTTTCFTETDLYFLPEPVQRYLRSCGYIGSKKQLYGLIRWKNVKMRLSSHGPWKKVDCHEFLAAPEPMRIMHLKTRIGGLLRLEAKDKYIGGHGNMLIKMAGMTLQDAKGREADASALVTFLSECLLLPACALAPYIRWEAVDGNTAAATIRSGDTEVNGVFYFNNRGEFIRFETGDRWEAGRHGEFIKANWMVMANDYIVENGISRPGHVVAAWSHEGKLKEYFKGEIGGIS